MLRALIIAAALLSAACADTAAIDGERAKYCEMVELHQRTGGVLGWPDFENRYKKECR